MCPLRPVQAGSYIWYQSLTSYSPVYTVASGGGITAMPNYVSQAYTVSQSGVSGSYTSYGGGSQCNVQCQGQLTAKFTWMPSPNKTMQSDPPPTCALVTQTSSASWSGTQGDASGSCANGLGSVVTTTNGGYSQSCSGSSVAPNSGGSSFQVSCTPTASASAGPMCCTCEAGISYSASAVPVFINPSSAVQDTNGKWDILIGQHCTPTVQVVTGSISNGKDNTSTETLASYLGSSDTLTYAWGLSDTSVVFQTWTPTTTSPPAAQANANASYWIDGPGPLNGPSPPGVTPVVPPPSWYWKNQGNDGNAPETITCNVTVTPPSGQGSSFSLSPSQLVQVWIPNWVCNFIGGQMYVGHLTVGSTGSTNTNNPNDFYLFAGETPPPPPSTGIGMQINATVKPPTATAALGTGGTSLFSNGSLDVAQLFTPGLYYTDNHGTSYIWSTNNQTGLDGVFPLYATQFGLNNPVVDIYSTNDSPGSDLTSVNAVSASVTDSFQDYLMFVAPGSSQPVPIAMLGWSTNGNARLAQGQSWSQFAGSSGYASAGAVTPSPAPNNYTAGSSVPFTASNTFPMWTQNTNASTTGNWKVAPN